jgi:hypothetical protein
MPGAYPWPNLSIDEQIQYFGPFATEVNGYLRRRLPTLSVILGWSWDFQGKAPCAGEMSGNCPAMTKCKGVIPLHESDKPVTCIQF